MYDVTLFKGVVRTFRGGYGFNFGEELTALQHFGENMQESASGLRLSVTVSHILHQIFDTSPSQEAYGHKRLSMPSALYTYSITCLQYYSTFKTQNKP